MENVALLGSSHAAALFGFSSHSNTRCSCGCEVQLTKMLFGFNAYEGNCPQCGIRWKCDGDRLIAVD